MGGLLSRELILQYGLKQDTSNFKILVEIATPHKGTQLGGIAETLGISTRLARVSREDSDFLAGLQHYWMLLGKKPYTYCIASPQDGVVNEESALFQCDDSVQFPQWGHKELVKPTNRMDDRYVIPISYLTTRQDG